MKSPAVNRSAIVLAAGATQFTMIGLLFAYGLFFKELEAEFGWSRTLLSSATSLAFLIMGAGAILAGRLADRYGPRLVLTIAGLLGGLAFVLLSQVREPWQLFVFFGLLIGVGMSSHDVVTLSTIARWFDRKRGIMTAMVKVGTAAGQVTVPPLAAVLMGTYGWKLATILLGGGGMVVLVIAASMMKSPTGNGAGGGGGEKTTGGYSFSQARATRSLWMLCLIQFLFFPPLMTVPLHIVVHGMDLGMTATLAATLLSTMATASVAGRLTIGFLFDRLGGQMSMIICFIPLIGSLVAMMFVAAPSILFVIVAIYGFAHGGFFTVVSPTVAEYFGLRAHGQIFGLIVFFGTIGGAVGPIVAGWIFDVSGSYFWAFGALAALVTAGFFLTMMLPAPQKGGGALSNN